MSIEQFIQPATLTEIRDKVRAFCVSAKLKIDNWRNGGVGQQMFEAFNDATEFYTKAAAKLVRGTILDYAVDPGDVDPYDSDNETFEQSAGQLSTLGEGTYGTVRQSRTFASGLVTFTNAGSIARTFSPYGLEFTGTTIDGFTPTYHNTPDATVYTNPDGSVTVPVGSSVTMPIECDTAGSVGTRATGLISLTTTLLGCTASNAEPVVGNDREDRLQYIDTCRLAMARLSLGGPAAAYAYLCKKNLDGTPLLNATGAEVGITRSYQTDDSATGEVTCYFASASGAPLAEDVTAANLNIEQQCMAVPDAITYTGLAAIAEPITVTGTARIRQVPGIDAATVKAAIVAALVAEWPSWPIGGVDRDATGAGVLYISDIEAIARSGYAGLYDVDCGNDGSYSIPAGHVPTLVTSAANWTLTVVP